MDDTVDVGVFGEDFIKSFLVGDVKLVVLRFLSTDEFNSVKDLRGGIVEVVNDHNLVVCFEEGEGRERADIASPAVSISVYVWQMLVSGWIYPVIKHDPAGMLMSVSETVG